MRSDYQIPARARRGGGEGVEVGVRELEGGRGEEVFDLLRGAGAGDGRGDEASDPSEDLVGILMTQRAWTSPAPPDVCVDF